MDVYQRRRLVALSAIAGIFIIFVLLIRSCGGDDEATPIAPVAGATGTTGASLLSQDDYVSQADAICLEANTALANVDETDLAQAAGEQEEIVTGQLQQLQTLRRPTTATTSSTSSSPRSRTSRSPTATRRPPPSAATTPRSAELDATIDEAQADVAKAAKKFGFEVCGDPSQVGDSDGGDSDQHRRHRHHRHGRRHRAAGDRSGPGDRRTRDGRAGARDGAPDGHRSRGPPGDRRGRHRLELGRRQPLTARGTRRRTTKGR